LSFGIGNAVGTSNGFIQSSGGQALASGTSGGNSTSSSDLTVLSANPGTFSATTGGGLSGGMLASVGMGGGSSGGNAVFGPSFAGADFAVGQLEPIYFPPTGGGGGGFGIGSGDTTGSITNPGSDANLATGNTQFFADEAYGGALANGFGFGQGSGVAVNSAGEQAGGQGGGTAFGQGNVAFELDDIQAATFGNSGFTNSAGGGGGYVGIVGINSQTPISFGASPTFMAGP
jgi:hypothetical protein